MGRFRRGTGEGVLGIISICLKESGKSEQRYRIGIGDRTFGPVVEQESSSRTLVPYDRLSLPQGGLVLVLL